MGRKSNKTIIKEQNQIIRELNVAYTFLLCAIVIFLYSVRMLNLNYNGINLNCMSLLFPVVFSVANVTAKDLGYKYGIKAIIISTITLFFYGAFTNFLTTGNFEVSNMLVITLAYFVTQLICLSTYNYFLINTRLPIFIVVCNYIFSSLVYNMIYMLFNYQMAITNSFWLEYVLLILFQGILSIILAIFDSIVERGIDY